MALYKTHTKFNLFIALPIITCILYLSLHPAVNNFLSFSGCFIYSTLFMSPDMDLANKIKLFSFKGVMTLPFRIYSFFFRHRGLSHNLIFGTLTRVLFLTLLFTSLLYLFDHSISQNLFLNFLRSYKSYIIYGFFGIFTADFCHLLLDIKKK